MSRCFSHCWPASWRPLKVRSPRTLVPLAQYVIRPCFEVNCLLQFPWQCWYNGMLSGRNCCVVLEVWNEMDEFLCGDICFRECVCQAGCCGNCAEGWGWRPGIMRTLKSWKSYRLKWIWFSVVMMIHTKNVSSTRSCSCKQNLYLIKYNKIIINVIFN